MTLRKLAWQDLDETPGGHCRNATRMAVLPASRWSRQASFSSIRGTQILNIPLGAGIDWRVGSRLRHRTAGSVRVAVPGEKLELGFHDEAPLLVANIGAGVVHDCLGDPGSARSALREISLSSPEGNELFRVLSVHWRHVLRADRKGSLDSASLGAEQEIIDAFVAAAFPDTSRDPRSASLRWHT